ncbi:MAG: GNAT family N-acetyltransferase [Alphaproteobacteria bacterium]|nr:GNAT family N-acetyltransferase [Alphaproteobacteria bacterium]
MGARAAGPPPILQPVGAEAFGLIAALYAAAFDEPWSEPSVRELMASPGVWGLVACRPAAGTDASDDKPTPVGFVLARVIAREAEVLAIGVAPAARRAGVARRLMAGVLAIAAPHADAIFLEVGADNPAAQQLYLALGFKEVGRRPDYYRRADGRRVDAAIMRRDFSTDLSRSGIEGHT